MGTTGETGRKSLRKREHFKMPPRTAAEAFEYMPEGTLCEVIENQLFMSPAPNRKHQEISSSILEVLLPFVGSNNLGKVYHAPIDVFIEPDQNVFQPDIVFISIENKKILSKRGIEGAPDLVIEILSPSNKEHDEVKKMAVYERCGVKEFWIVDPEKGETYGMVNEKKKFKKIGKPSKVIKLKMFDLEIDLSKEL